MTSGQTFVQSSTKQWLYYRIRDGQCGCKSYKGCNHLEYLADNGARDSGARFLKLSEEPSVILGTAEDADILMSGSECLLFIFKNPSRLGRHSIESIPGLVANKSGYYNIEKKESLYKEEHVFDVLSALSRFNSKYVGFLEVKPQNEIIRTTSSLFSNIEGSKDKTQYNIVDRVVYILEGAINTLGIERSYLTKHLGRIALQLDKDHESVYETKERLTRELKEANNMYKKSVDEGNKLFDSLYSGRDSRGRPIQRKPGPLSDREKAQLNDSSSKSEKQIKEIERIKSELKEVSESIIFSAPLVYKKIIEEFKKIGDLDNIVSKIDWTVLQLWKESKKLVDKNNPNAFQYERITKLFEFYARCNEEK